MCSCSGLYILNSRGIQCTQIWLYVWCIHTPHVDQPKVEFWCYVDPREAIAGDLCPPSLERPGSAVQPSHQLPPRCSYSPSHGVSPTPPLPSLFLPIAPPRRYHHVRSMLPRRRSLLSWQPPPRRLIGWGVGSLSTARKPAYLQHRTDTRLSMHHIWVKYEQEIKSKSRRLRKQNF